MAATVSIERKVQELVNRIRDEQGLRSFSSLLAWARQWGYRLNPAKWERFFLLNLEERIQSLHDRDDISSILEGMECVIKAAEMLEVTLNLWNIQNRFVEVCRAHATDFEASKESIKTFTQLVGMSPEVLPPNLR